MNLPEIGETITTERALELCKFFRIDYLTERIKENPDSYKLWTFDGASYSWDTGLAFMTGVEQNDLTFKCALPHDLRYGYGEIENCKERADADSEFKMDLIYRAKMNRVSAWNLYAAVRIGGCNFFGIKNASWGFANKSF